MSGRARHRGDPSAMRSVNRTLVVDAIRRHAPLARADIARLTSISPPSISAIVEALIHDGLVEETGERPSDIGRPGRLLAFSERVAYVGCDLSEAGVARIGVINLAGTLTEPSCLPLPASAPEEIAEAVVSQLHSMQAGGGTVFQGVGVGVPGTTDAASGFVHWAPALGWESVPFGEILARRLGAPVCVDNDVNLALIGEVERGAASDARHAVLLAFADGVGGALLIDGRLYRGRESAGEVGYLVTDASRAAGDFRSFGFLERQIFEIVAAECRRRRRPPDGHGRRTAALSRALAEPDGSLQLSRRGYRELLTTVAGALASVSALLDPEVVLLAGWVEQLGSELLIDLEAAVSQLVPHAPAIRFSALDSSAVAIGAALSARRIGLEAVHLVQGAV